MKRSKEVPSDKRLLSNKHLMMILFVIVVTVLGFVLYSFLQTQEVKFSLKAAIVDQLGEEFPNPDFTEDGDVADILERAGFTVSYHRSETINVAFYKELAKHNYGIILLRSHSATREDKTIVDFFTCEEYNIGKYHFEQDNDWLTKGYYSWKQDEYYFAIAPKFIENLGGSFPKSIVIAMGCYSMSETYTEMAEAFMKKGAAAYIGWTGPVQPSHTDNETVRLLSKLLVENETLREAVDSAKRDPLFRSRMEYYPSKAGNLTISSLSAEVKTSSISLATTTLFEPIVTVYLCKASTRIRRTLDSAYC